jgi:putative sugar O-methyltransferase
MIYARYTDLCRHAVDDEEVFKTFKNRSACTYMLEHVTYEQGLGYLAEIKRLQPKLLNHIECFATNDSLGTPQVFRYDELNLDISPTTLRYVKVLADLIYHFGSLSMLDIVEIGVGYGGQCKIINEYFVPKSYTLVDLPDVLTLAKKYLTCHGIENIALRSHLSGLQTPYNLCISNYAFTEISRQCQDFYAKNIISLSDKGYITCNFLNQRMKDHAMTDEEIYRMKQYGDFIDEVPLTAPHNAIYIWEK